MSVLQERTTIIDLLPRDLCFFTGSRQSNGLDLIISELDADFSDEPMVVVVGIVTA